MLCYECLESGSPHKAIGLCHHCSIALCEHHGHVVRDPVTTILPLVRVIALPKAARLLLCNTCLNAMMQVREYQSPDASETPHVETAGVR